MTRLTFLHLLPYRRLSISKVDPERYRNCSSNGCEIPGW